MTVTDTLLSPLRHQVQVTVPLATIQAEEKKILAQFAKEVQLPGFRPGKAPAEMVRRRFAKQIESELRQNLMREAYDKAVASVPGGVAAIVKAEGGEFTLLGDGTATFTFDARPEFALPPYAGLTVQVPESAPTDEEVDAEITNMRRERSDFRVVERPVQKGDYVKLSYVGTVQGQLIADIVPNEAMWGTQNNTWEEAGATPPMGVPAIVEGIIGMAVGEKKTVTMDFAENFVVADLAKKQGVYEVEVHEVRERVLAEVNDSFLQDLKVESLAQLKEQIRERIASRKANQAEAAARQQVAEALSQAVEFDLPESLLERETQTVMAEVMQANMRRGVPETEFEKHKQELYDNSKQVALRRVKWETLLERIAEAEKIELEENDLMQAVYMEAQRSRTPVDKLVKELRGNQDRLQRLRRGVLLDKTWARLVSLSQRTVVSAAPAPEGTPAETPSA